MTNIRENKEDLKVMNEAGSYTMALVRCVGKLEPVRISLSQLHAFYLNLCGRL